MARGLRDQRQQDEAQFAGAEHPLAPPVVLMAVAMMLARIVHTAHLPASAALAHANARAGEGAVVSERTIGTERAIATEGPFRTEHAAGAEDRFGPEAVGTSVVARAVVFVELGFGLLVEVPIFGVLCNAALDRLVALAALAIMLRVIIHAYCSSNDIAKIYLR